MFKIQYLGFIPAIVVLGYLFSLMDKDERINLLITLVMITLSITGFLWGLS